MDDFKQPMYRRELSAADTTYSLVANPYAAVVNWKTVTKNDVSTNIYYFDPTIAGSNGRGGYVSYNELYNTVSNPSSNLNYFIQSGQAFFVRTTGPNPSITFGERDKASTHRPVFTSASVLPGIAVICRNRKGETLKGEKMGRQIT